MGVSASAWRARARSSAIAPRGDELAGEAAARDVERIGVAVAVVAVAAQTVVHLVNDLALDERVWHMNADVDGNLLTWASASATLAAGVAAAVLGRAGGPYGRRLFVLAAILGFFAVDDVVAIHEDLGSGLAVVGLPNVSGVWFPLYLPVFVLTAWLLWTLPAPARARMLVRVGLLLLAAAIVGEGTATGFVTALDRYEDRWPYSVEVAIEEGAELGGWILIATGLTAAVLLARAPGRNAVALVPGHA